MKKWSHLITEASYPGNIGFSEMAKYYKTATPSQLKELEKIIKSEDWDAFKAQIKKVLGVKLK